MCAFSPDEAVLSDYSPAKWDRKKRSHRGVQPMDEQEDISQELAALLVERRGDLVDAAIEFNHQRWPASMTTVQPLYG